MAVYSLGQHCLNALMSKLDHPIDEIKCRALDSISSKVQHELIATDRLPSTLLIKKLLEWLDRNPLLSTPRVIRLLESVVKNPQSQKEFVYADGLAILSRARNKLKDDELKGHIDAIFASISGTQIGGFNSSNSAPQQKADFCQPSGYFNFSGSSVLTSSSTFSMSQTDPRKLLYHPGVPESFTSLIPTNSNNLEEHGISGPDENSSITTSSDFFVEFPTLLLTKTDMDVLLTSISTVKSTDNETAISGINFFQDVILEDFPAEVFIQRPAFVEAFLGMIGSTKTQLMFAAARALSRLCEKLINRIYFHLDPNNHCLFPGLGYVSTLESLNNQIPGQMSVDGHTISTNNADRLSSTDQVVRNLSNRQTLFASCYSNSITPNTVDCDRPGGYPIFAFCLDVLVVVGHALHYLVTQHLAFPTPSQSTVNHSRHRSFGVTEVKYQLEAELLCLMRVAVDLMLTSIAPLNRMKRRTGSVFTSSDPADSCTSWMMRRNPPAHDLINPCDLPGNFTTFLEPWGPLLSALSSTWCQQDGISNSWSASELIQFVSSNAVPYAYERHIYLSVFGHMFNLITTLFTPETALSVLPTELRTQMALALLDSALLLRTGRSPTESVDQGLPAYVLLFNSPIVTTWNLLNRVELSMTSLIGFLEQMKQYDENGDVTLLSESTLNLAIAGVDSLGIVGSSQFASGFVRFLNDLSTKNRSVGPATLWLGQLTLLNLLSHSLDLVRKATYAQLKEVVCHAIDPRVVADPTQAPNDLIFLLHRDVLIQCVEFGLKDTNAEIRSLTEQLLVCLLNSYELLSQSSWRTLYHLILDTYAPEACSSVGSTYPLSVIFGPHAVVPSVDRGANPTFGELVLDWCLGLMTPSGRRLAAPGWKSVLPDEPVNSHGISHSCGRLLFHPDDKVREAAAAAFAEHFQVFCSGHSQPAHPVERSTSTAAESRVVTGMSVSTECADASKPVGMHKTSTPVDRNSSELLLVQTLTNCLVFKADSSSGQQQTPSFVLDHQDHILSGPVDTNQADSVPRLMQVFIDCGSDLGVRRAAGEQLLFLIRSPLILEAWLANHGLQQCRRLVEQTVEEHIINNARTKSPDPYHTLMPPDSSSSVLLPLLLRMFRFSLVWKPNIRQQLSTEDFLFYLIYLLIMHPDCSDMHRNLVDIISLVLFHPVIQMTEECPVSLPESICAGYRLPFTCATYSLRCHWNEAGNNSRLSRCSPFEVLLDLLSTHAPDQNTMAVQNLVRRSFRYSWSFACHAGPSNFIRHSLNLLGSSVNPNAVDPDFADLCFRRSHDFTPFTNQLSLSCGDLTLLLLSCPDASTLLSLIAIQQATSHAALVQSLSLLHRSFEAHFSHTGGIVDVPLESKCHWWTFCHLERFLATLPSCSADFHLLASLLETIERLGIRSSLFPGPSFDTSWQLCSWLMDLLVDTQGPLAYCLLEPSAAVGQTDSHRLASSKHYLVDRRLPQLIYCLTERLRVLNVSSNEVRQVWPMRASLWDSSLSDAPNQTCPVKPVEFLNLCLQWVQNSLKGFLGAPFSDLIRLRLVLGVLSNVTSPSLWHAKFDESSLLVLLHLTTTILTKFDSGREESSDSFIGMGPLRLMLTIVANIVHRISANRSLMNAVLSKDELTLRSLIDAQSSHPLQWPRSDWLLRCTVYRSVEVRALGLCILSRICLIPDWARDFTSFEPSVDTKTLLATRSRTLPPSGGRLWCIAISTLFDQKEACSCYAHAVDMLTNLTSLPIDSNRSGIFVLPSVESTYRSVPQAPSLQTHFSSSGRPLSSEERASTDTEALNEAPSAPGANTAISAGDRPTLTTSTQAEEDSDVLDLRDLFNSELDSNELRHNFAELLGYLRPWFSELFVEGGVQQLNTVTTTSQPLLIHTSTVPRDTILPCFSDHSSGLCLLGLPALQHLVIGQKLFQVLHRFLAAYLPQPVMEPSRWKGLSSGLCQYPSHMGGSTHATPQIVGTTNQQCPNRVPTETVHSETICSDSAASGSLCTPLLVGSICQLLTNLMHHLPYIISTELTRYRIHSLLMNIVDPNLLEVLLKITPHTKGPQLTSNSRVDIPHDPSNPWSTGIVHLSSAFAACLRVLRCEASMNKATCAQLGSDARFLARLIRSVKHTECAEFLFPLWQEIFLLLTCILMISEEDEKSANIWVRLILRPLSAYVDSWLDVILAIVDHAEAELKSSVQNSSVFCRHARSALCFLIVSLSKHRPLSSNPIICALDAGPDARASLSRLMHRLVSLVTSNFVSTDQISTSSAQHPFSLLVSSKLPSPVINYRRTLLTALRTLLGVCRSAKEIALEEGLLEELVINIQLLQAKLDLCCITASSSSTDVRRPGSARNQAYSNLRQVTVTWTNLTEELIANFEIVHNLVYVHPEAKKRAIDVGFPQLAYQLWPLGLQDNRILHALLSLLTNLTADYPYGASALAKGMNVVQAATLHGLLTPSVKREAENTSRTGRRVKSGTVPSTGRSEQSNAPSDTSSSSLIGCSLVQLLCQLLPKFALTTSSRTGSNANLPATARSLARSDISNDVPMLSEEVTSRLVYQLLANLVWSTEARSVLIKTKVLHRCAVLEPRVLSKSRRGQFMLSLWLQLLVNLSFTADGQQVLCSQPRIPELVENCVLYLKGYTRETALLTLRNLCTSTAFKARFVTGDTQTIECAKGLLLRSEQDPHRVRLVTLGVSVLQALAHGNEKARAMIRSAGFLHHLTQLWTRCQTLAEFSEVIPKVQALLAQLQT
ncbi:Rotatin [Clonorchis sinensis]|uniref:Rotatin n=1 Tax=Clonorchis sinensis TaxID=79923 RepID=A0A8T1M8N4_CLOSI|nr:Rotatin [Clonorchis sinensis]